MFKLSPLFPNISTGFLALQASLNLYFLNLKTYHVLLNIHVVTH